MSNKNVWPIVFWSQVKAAARDQHIVSMQIFH